MCGRIALLTLDYALTRASYCYARFMDDRAVLRKTRNQLSKVMEITNKVLCALKQSKHPRKTFIGRIQKGFDFLGYHLKIGSKTRRGVILQ